MPLGGALTIGLSALGGLFSNRSGTTKQSSTSNSTQHQDSTSNPVYDPKSQALRDILINYYLDNLKSNGDFFNGYTQEGLSNINKSADSSQRQMENMLASRGIQGPMAGAGLTAPLMQRQGQVSNFLNSIPMLQDQRQQGILSSGAQFLSSLPVGQHNVSDGISTTNSTGSQTTPGNMLGGLFGNAGIAAMGLWGNKASSSPQTSSPSVVSASLPASQSFQSLNPGNFMNYNSFSNPANVLPPPSYATPWLPKLFTTPYGGTR